MTRRDPITLDLFEVPRPVAPLPAAMDYRAQISGIVGEMLKQSDADRFEIAARCSRLTGKEISKYMLDAYASEAREEYNAPAWLIPALEVACDSYLYTNWLALIRGGRLLLGRETLTAELGRLERLRDTAARQIKDIKKRMGAP